MKPDYFEQWLNISTHTIMNKEVATPVEETMQWITQFITQPHEQLGRTGAVCPFAEPAIKQQQLHFYITADTHPTKEVLCPLLQKLCHQFLEYLQSPEASPLLSLIVLFPLWKETSYHVLKEVRMVVKPHFLANGVTLGEFYPGNPDISIRSGHLKIADSPYPMVVIRTLAVHDKLFLQSQGDLFAYYLEKFPKHAAQ